MVSSVPTCAASRCVLSLADGCSRRRAAAQTYSYGRHFLSSCVRVMGYEGVKSGVDSRGHITHIGHCPIGIDADRIELDRRQPGARRGHTHRGDDR
jgi:trehalose-6-phosphate synthase